VEPVGRESDESPVEDSALTLDGTGRAVDEASQAVCGDEPRKGKDQSGAKVR
jgi:hypothetical protein